MRSAIPVNRFIQRPIHISGTKRLNASGGMPFATPSSRKANAPLSPASKPRPMVWAARMPGNANSESDSRIQTLNALDSNQRKSGSNMCVFVLRR